MRSNSCYLLVLALVVVALTTAGCYRSNILYHHYEPTPVSGWGKNDTLLFAVAPARQRAVVQREVELRMAGSYPYQQMSLIVEQTTLPSAIRRRDTLSCQLISPEGKIQGDGVSLYYYRFRIPDISLNEGDSLSLRVRHNMKRESLPGIADVGICLTAY